MRKFWLACANLIKNAKINYADFAKNYGKISSVKFGYSKRRKIAQIWR